MKIKPVILVTGGAGYIAGFVVNYLRDAGYKVFVFDKKIKKSLNSKFFIKGDLLNKKDIEKAIKLSKCKTVLHFAAYANSRESILDPVTYFENNVSGTFNLLKVLSSQKHSPNLVFSSSSSVYGDGKKSFIKETDELLPISPYGETKVFCEKIISWFSRQYGLKPVILRFFNVAGADEKFGGDSFDSGRIITEACLVATGRKDNFVLNGNPNSSRDYVHVYDIALLCERIIAKSFYRGIYNVGSGKSFSNIDILNAVKKKSSVSFKVVSKNKNIADPDKVVADIKKIYKDLGWKPAHSSLNEIVESSWKWYSSFVK